MRRYLLSLSTVFIILALYSYGYGAEKKVNLLGLEICPNSAGSLLRDEVSGMSKDDTLLVLIESDRKDIIQTAIKLEKLPVVYEEKPDKDTTTFIIRLKEE